MSLVIGEFGELHVPKFKLLALTDMDTVLIVGGSEFVSLMNGIDSSVTV
jgi:hypothetical protein